MLHRQGLLLLLHHLARGGDRREDVDAQRGCEALGHAVCNGSRPVGGLSPTRARSPISAAVRNDISSLNVRVSCMLSQGRLSRRFVVG